MSKVLYTFMPNKSYAYLLNVQPNDSFFFSETYYTEFDEIIIAFTDQNLRSWEIEGKVDLALLINK